MGKGTLITSPTTFALRALRADPCLTGSYAGHVYVSCNDGDDPDGASPYPLVQNPIPRGIRSGDFVSFEHVPLLTGHGRCKHTVRIVDRARRDACNEDELLLKIKLFEEKMETARKKPVPRKKAPKKAKKKK
jgi:hypothetical protein